MDTFSRIKGLLVVFFETNTENRSAILSFRQMFVNEYNPIAFLCFSGLNSS